MKKLTIRFLVLAISFIAQNGTAQYLARNLYGIKEGIIHYKSTSNFNFPGQPSYITEIEGKVYFDNYGNTRSNIFTETQNMAELKVTRHLQNVYIEDYKYTLDLDTQKGIEEKTNKRVDKITNYDNPDKEDAELFTFEFSGAGTFLNKPCRLYTVTEKQGSKSVSKVTVWKNIVLKRVTSSSVLNYTFEVTKLEETPPDATLLSLPDDIVIE